MSKTVSKNTSLTIGEYPSFRVFTLQLLPILKQAANLASWQMWRLRGGRSGTASSFLLGVDENIAVAPRHNTVWRVVHSFAATVCCSFSHHNNEAYIICGWTKYTYITYIYFPVAMVVLFLLNNLFKRSSFQVTLLSRVPPVAFH